MLNFLEYAHPAQSSNPSYYHDMFINAQGNVARTYKIGVMYCGEQQQTEDQMYANRFGSDAFEDFLALLGDRVTLKSFTKFKGGLDAQSKYILE